MNDKMVETFITSDDGEILNRLKSEGIQNKEQLEELFSHSLFLILPTTISSRKDLNSNDKMLLGEIMALSRSRGYCGASNEHLAKQLGVSEKTIYRSLKKLYQSKLLNIKLQKNHSGAYRFIVLNLQDIMSIKDKLSIPKDNLSAPKDKLSVPIYIEDSKEESIEETPNPLKGAESFKPIGDQQHNQNGTEPLEASGFNLKAEFEVVWASYPPAERKGRKLAMRYFNASVKTPQDVMAIKSALEAYKKSKYYLSGFIQNAKTWFNNWQDYVPTKETTVIPDIQKKQNKLANRECASCKYGKIEPHESFSGEIRQMCNQCGANYTDQLNTVLKVA